MSDPTAERRVAVRWTSSQQASCHFATLQKITSRWARILNVSAQGIGLVLPCVLEQGQELIVELPCKNLAESRLVNARVIHVQEQEPGAWAVGCEFDKTLTNEELEMLL